MIAPTLEPAPLFPSFFLAGFECSTHRVRRGRRTSPRSSPGPGTTSRTSAPSAAAAGPCSSANSRAAIAASHAVRDVAPGARLCHVDPVIHTPAAPERPRSRPAAAAYEAGMWEAWDTIAGRREPALGGSPALLDVVGVNFYPRNQWVYRGRRLRGPVLRPGDPLHRPLSQILAAVHARYGRPLFVAETGCEGDDRPRWLAEVAGEVQRARAAGVPVHGICWYPILTHPGWEDSRHLTCGVWDYPPGSDGARATYRPLLDELARWRPVFESAPAALAPV